MQSLGILRALRHIQNNVDLWNIIYTEFSVTCHLKTRGIFKVLSNIYNGTFCSEPCVTLAYLKLWHVQNLRNIWNPVKHL